MALRANIQKTSYAKSGVAVSFPITSNGNFVAGDHGYILVLGWQGATGAAISGITDDQGGTWAKVTDGVTTAEILGANNHRIGLWRGTGFSGGASLTADIAFTDQGTAGFFTAYIVSASSMVAAAANDVDTAENGNGTTITTDTITTTAATTLIFAGTYAIDNGSGAINVPTGWTGLSETEGSENSSFVYREEVSTGSFSAVWTTANTCTAPISVIAAFEVSGGGAPPSSRLLSLLGVG
jgi:hypothetical protein